MIRWMLGLGALLMGGYGGWLLLTRQDGGQVVEAGTWLVTGVVAHDGLVAGLALLGGVVVTALPRIVRAPVAIALVVLGTLSLVALPVLGGWGSDPGNSTHLDRSYVTAWVVLTTVTATGVLVVSLVGARRARSERS